MKKLLVRIVGAIAIGFVLFIGLGLILESFDRHPHPRSQQVSSAVADYCDEAQRYEEKAASRSISHAAAYDAAVAG